MSNIRFDSVNDSYLTILMRDYFFICNGNYNHMTEIGMQRYIYDKLEVLKIDISKISLNFNIKSEDYTIEIKFNNEYTKKILNGNTKNQIERILKIESIMLW